MSQTSEEDKGPIAVLMKRLNEQRLPRALELRDRVNGGDVLTELDIKFLSDVFEDTNRIKPLIERNSEYHEIVGRMVSLYKEITDKALANEQAKGKP
jgi:hypothetical protein